MKNTEKLIHNIFPDIALSANDEYCEAHLSKDDFSRVAITLITEHEFRLALLYGTDDRVLENGFGVHAVLTTDELGADWLVLHAKLEAINPSYPSLTTHTMSAYWYERYLHDMFGITPTAHPDLRRLVHHENIPLNTFPLRKDFQWDTKLPVADVPFPMLGVEGEGVFEVPVGPIHAGIIEPGHFRFSVAGERIITLEGKLFFTHKGVEKLLEGKTPKEALPFIERISGDMAVGHTLAFVSALDAAEGRPQASSTHLQRALMLELERITMHIHDISNIGGMGTGFALISSRGFAYKERMMQLSEKICGNRFWRDIVTTEGVSRIFSEEELSHIEHTTQVAAKDLLEVADIALSSLAFCERLETTGVLPRDAAIAYGALGIAARASGVLLDARVDHPSGAHIDIKTNISVREEGDIMARFMLRIDEIRESLQLIEIFAAKIRSLGSERAQTVVTPKHAPLSNGFGIGVCESWRGEVLVALTLKDGKIERCVVRDPSFCNWNLFGELAPGNIIPDFPLCNKSLNLSYSGTDM